MLKTILEILTPAVAEFQQKMGIVPQNDKLTADREALHKRLLIEELKEYDAESEFSENRVWEYLDIWWVALGWAYELGQTIKAPNETQLIHSPQSLIALLQTEQTSSQFPALVFRVIAPRSRVATKYAHALCKSNMSKFCATEQECFKTYLANDKCDYHLQIGNGWACYSAKGKLVKGINFIEKQYCL
jgi:hypothetical protein